jgi:phenolic acid decarboxylase
MSKKGDVRMMPFLREKKERASLNRNLHTAKRNKNDEFYTQLADIERELAHYRKHFKNKVVLCNCDDPRVSNFFYYFSYNFGFLGLKKLITTCYQNDQIDLFSQNDKEEAIYLEYTGTKNENEVPSLEEIGINRLKGNGDFRSKECVELLKQADIVCTNPQKFLIIGNYNAVTYKEIFPLIKNNKMWLGVTLDGRNVWFGIPDYYEKYHKIENGMKYAFVPGVGRYKRILIKRREITNKRNEELILVKSYKGNEQHYPKYDNYDAIEVSRVINIPKDYNGVMGVPITFLNKYNPEQFEIVGNGQTMADELGIKPVGQKFVDDYYMQGNKGSINAKWNNLVYHIGKKVYIPYQRILIKRREITIRGEL